MKPAAVEAHVSDRFDTLTPYFIKADTCNGALRVAGTERLRFTPCSLPHGAEMMRTMQKAARRSAPQHKGAPHTRFSFRPRRTSFNHHCKADSGAALSILTCAGHQTSSIYVYTLILKRANGEMTRRGVFLIQLVHSLSPMTSAASARVCSRLHSGLCAAEEAPTTLLDRLPTTSRLLSQAYAATPDVTRSQRKDFDHRRASLQRHGTGAGSDA